MRKTSVYIGTPMYGGLCYHGYVDSLISNILDLKKHKIDVFWEFLGNESLITRGRNYISDSFLKSPCSHLMFIDSDIIFPYDAIRKLLSVKENLVCAAYPKKMIDWNNVYNKCREEPNLMDKLQIDNIKKTGASYVLNLINNTINFSKPNKKGLIEVSQAGTGFMLISREVFLKMRTQMKQARASNFGANNSWYTEYFKTEVGEDGILQSEDWVFCNQWRKVEGKVWLMPEIELKHIGTHVYEGNLNKFGANLT